MKPLFTFVALLCYLPAVFAQPAGTVSGTVLGHDGRPMPLAHVSLHPASGGPALQAVAAGPDGTFSLSPDTTGIFSLWFTGVDHLVQQVPLLFEAPGTAVALDVRLRTHTYREDLSEVALIGDFNGYAFSKGSIPLARQPDGTFAADVEVDADTLGYQVINVLAQQRSINGTQSDWYVYDGGGDYRSVVRVDGGRVRIVYDPAKRAVSSAGPVVSFRDAETDAARFAAFDRALQATQEAYREAYDALREREAGQDELEAFREAFDWSPDETALREALGAASAASMRHALMARYLGSGTRVDSATAVRALAAIPPASPVWAAYPMGLMRAVSATGRRADYAGYMDDVIEAQTHAELVASLLMMQIGEADREGDEARVRALYDRLMRDYGDTVYARMAKTQYDPNRAIREGAPVPDFEVAALGEPGTTYSRENLKGRTYLIDFWAVWCGPCIAEMPNLHAAYEAYRDRGFTIVSLSFDEKPEDVAEYRQGEWKMPWLHAFLDGGFEHELAKRFEVIGIPKPVLVGPDGTVVATESDLRGDSLETTLARLFGDAAAGSE